MPNLLLGLRSMSFNISIVTFFSIISLNSIIDNIFSAVCLLINGIVHNILICIFLLTVDLLIRIFLLSNIFCAFANPILPPDVYLNLAICSAVYSE